MIVMVKLWHINIENQSKEYEYMDHIKGRRSNNDSRDAHERKHGARDHRGRLISQGPYD